MFALESPAVWLGHGYLQLVAAANSGLAESTAEGSADGEILAQALEPDETRQAITFLIVCLIGIALLLAVLTVWYWHFTSPKRRASSLLSDLGHYESDPNGAVSAPESPPVLAGVGGPSPAPDQLRLPTPALAPAIDDRTTSEPAFSSAGPAAVSTAASPPVAPPELPTKRPRRAAEPQLEPASSRRASEPKPATPRRIEVAARAETGEPARLAKPVAGDAEPIFADRGLNAGRNASAKPAPSPVETKTGASKPGSSGAATITHRGPVVAPKPAASTAASAEPRTADQKRSVVASSHPPACQQSEKASLPPAEPHAAGTSGGQEGLSDDDWAAVMQSAFSKLNK